MRKKNPILLCEKGSGMQLQDDAGGKDVAKQGVQQPERHMQKMCQLKHRQVLSESCVYCATKNMLTQKLMLFSLSKEENGGL